MRNQSVLLVGADNLAERVEAYKRLLPADAITILKSESTSESRNTFLGVPVAHEWPQENTGIADIAGDISTRSVTARRALGAAVGRRSFTRHSAIRTPTRRLFLLQSGGSVRVALPVHFTHKYETAAQSARTGIGEIITVRAIRVFAPAQAWQQSLFQLMESLVLLGGPLQRIYAKAASLKASNTDTVYCNGRYANRAIFYGEMSAAYPSQYRKEVIEVTGREGMVEYDSNARSFWMASESGVTLTEAYHRSPYEKMAAAYLQSWEADSESTQGLPDPLPILHAYWAAMESIERNEVVTL